MRVRFGSSSISCALFATIALCVGGCGKSESTASKSPTPTAPSSGSPAWVLVSMPEGVVDIAAAKKIVKEGDIVAVRGRIGGRVDPISKDTAVFIVMDPALHSCDQNEGDTCATPWDYCCETPESMAANNATVQVVDASGAPIAVDVQTVGFKPLDTVVIVGTVGPRPTPQVLTIKATGVHRVGG